MPKRSALNYLGTIRKGIAGVAEACRGSERSDVEPARLPETYRYGAVFYGSRTAYNRVVSGQESKRPDSRMEQDPLRSGFSVFSLASRRRHA